MSSRVLEGSWEGDPSNLWSLSTTPTPIYVNEGSLGTAISANSGAPASSPFTQRRFASPFDLRPYKELRFWFRSSRPGDGSSGKPFYLTFEAASDPPGSVWKRLLPVKQPDYWELHQLWLEDMPANLRQAVSFLRLRSLNATVAFSAIIGDLVAVTPEPLQDVDTALLKRLDRRFQASNRSPTNTAAFVDLPENPGDRTLPYILITPWAIHSQRERGGSGEIIDNYTTDGAFNRPQPWLIDLDFSIDVFAQERAQKTLLLDEILNDFSREPFLVVNGERLAMNPFMPTPEESARFVSPGRTPLFYRLTTEIETGDRRFQRQAVPFLQMGTKKDRATLEATDRATSEAMSV